MSSKHFNKWIKNITATMDFSHSTKWENNIDIPGSMKAVEIIIRQITYVPDVVNANDECIIIWCNINNNIIASVSGSITTAVSPQTTISVSHPFVGLIEFQAFLINSEGQKVAFANAAGKIAISMDIIGTV